MWLKNDGVILAELLLSLSALLMICLFFIPLWLDITNQTLKLQIEKNSHQFVYEELQALIINGQPSINHSVIQNGIEYQITSSTTDADQTKVCVKVEKNSFHSEIKLCGISE